jgi:hypothetical protein
MYAFNAVITLEKTGSNTAASIFRIASHEPGIRRTANGNERFWQSFNERKIDPFGDA